MIFPTATETGTMILFTQKGSQPATGKAVQELEDVVSSVFEVVEPAPQNRIEFLDDLT